MSTSIPNLPRQHSHPVQGTVQVDSASSSSSSPVLPRRDSSPETQEYCERLLQELAHKDQVIHNLGTIAQNLSEENENLQETVTEKETKIKKLEEEIYNFGKTLERISRECEEQKDQIADKEVRTEQLEVQAARFRSRILTLEREIHAIQQNQVEAPPGQAADDLSPLNKLVNRVAGCWRQTHAFCRSHRLPILLVTASSTAMLAVWFPSNWEFLYKIVQIVVLC